MNETSSGAPTGDAAAVGARVPLTAHPFVRVAFITEESVYGVILVSGMIVVSGGHGASSWNVFLSVIVTVLVFWAAHLYAGTVAHHALDHEHIVGLREAFRGAFRRSLGLLASALIPSFILLLGATEAIPDALALWSALWAGVIVLAVIGFVAFRRRGASWPMQIAGAFMTAAFGGVMIILKAFVH